MEVFPDPEVGRHPFATICLLKIWAILPLSGSVAVTVPGKICSRLFLFIALAIVVLTPLLLSMEAP